MIRKLILISSLLILPALIIACTGNSSSDKAKVTIDLSGVDAVKSLTGVPFVDKAEGDTVPAAIDTVEIIVKDADGDVVYDREFYRSDFESTNTFDLEVPSGEDMVFTAKGRDITRFLIYEGVAAGNVNLTPGEDKTVSIIMTEAEPPALDAQVALNLKGEDGEIYTNPGYLAAANMIDARVFRPRAEVVDGEEKILLGDPMDTDTLTAFGTSLTGLMAYPETYQVIVVRAVAPDGTIAAIGSKIVAGLKSGTNEAIDVRMFRPVVLVVKNTQQITSIQVQISGIGTVLNSENETVEGINSDQVIVRIPNRVKDIKTGIISVPAEAREMQIVINGDELPTYNFNDSYFPKALKWKKTFLDLTVGNDAWSILED